MPPFGCGLPAVQPHVYAVPAVPPAPPAVPPPSLPAPPPTPTCAPTPAESPQTRLFAANVVKGARFESKEAVWAAADKDQVLFVRRRSLSLARRASLHSLPQNR